jgi:hypothetical protein
MPAALFNKTSTLPKLSIRFATCFLLLHNDVHHIVGKTPPVSFSSSDAVFGFLSREVILLHKFEKILGHCLS